MKKTTVVNIFLLSSLSLLMCSNTQADYVMKIPLKSDVAFKETASGSGTTTPTQPELLTSTTSWENSGVVSCSSWTPDVSTMTTGKSFSQTGSNCSQDQIRQYEEYYLDGSGNKVTTSSETQHQAVSVASSTRTAVGTQPEFMFSTASPKYGYFCRVSRNGYGTGYYFYERTIYWNDVLVFTSEVQSNTDICAEVQTISRNYVGTDGSYQVNEQHYVKRILR